MSVLDTDRIQLAIDETVQTDPTGDVAQTCLYADHGDVRSALKFNHLADGDRLFIEWEVPLELIQVEDPIIPDDGVNGRTTNYPIDNNWTEKAWGGADPTLATELGATVTNGVETIHQAVAASSSLANGVTPGDGYVMRADTRPATPYCTIPFIFDIE